MDVELTEKKMKEKMNKDDMLITEFTSIYNGSAGGGYSEVTAKITLSSEDQAALDRFGVSDIADKRNFTLKEITTLGDFKEKTEDDKL